MPKVVIALLLFGSLTIPAASSGAVRSVAVTRAYTDTDTREPSDPSAPNIAAVEVSRSASGTMSFRIVFAKPVRITPDMGFDIWINADRSPRSDQKGLPTGDEDGDDYTLDFSRDTPTQSPYASLYAYANGKEYRTTPPTLAFSKSARQVVFRISTRDMGFGLSKRLAKHQTAPYLPELGDSFDFLVGAGPRWNDEKAPVDWTPTWTFPRRGITADYPSGGTGSFFEGWQLLGGAILLLGAIVGLGGYAYEKARRSRRVAL
jgi:hypothetical protein